MCILSIKLPIRKKSGNLFNDPRIYIYIYMEVSNGVKSDNISRKIDNKVMPVEGEIYWEAKATLKRFSSNKPPSRLRGMI